MPPAADGADGAGSSYHRLLRAVLCYIGKMYFCLTQFAVDRPCLLKISVEPIKLVWEQRFGSLKRDIGHLVAMRLFVRLSEIINGIGRYFNLHCFSTR